MPMSFEQDKTADEYTDNSLSGDRSKNFYPVLISFESLDFKCKGTVDSAFGIAAFVTEI